MQLQSFAFKVLYRTIPCRVYLSQIKVVHEETCSRCAARDDLCHFFFKCPSVKDFWDSLASWMGGQKRIQDFPDGLTEEEFLLGIVEGEGDHSLLNYIMLYARFYIHKKSIFTAEDPSLFQFLSELKSRLIIERLCCLREGSFQRRFEGWNTFLDNLYIFWG